MKLLVQRLGSGFSQGVSDTFSSCMMIPSDAMCDYYGSQLIPFIGFCQAHIHMAISARVFRQIILMIFFSRVKVSKRLHFHDYRAAVGGTTRIDEGINYREVLFVIIKNPAAVLGPPIVALPIQRGGIDNPEEMIQDILKRNY